MDNDNKLNKIPTKQNSNKPKQDRTGDWFAVVAVIVILGVAVSNSSKTNQQGTQTQTQQQTNTIGNQTIEKPADTTLLFIDKIFDKQHE